MRRPLALTFVSYEENDAIIGKFLAFSSLLPFFVFSVLLGMFIMASILSPSSPSGNNNRTNIKLMLFVCLCGLVLNEIITRILKGFFQQNRPDPMLLSGERVDFGMPSSHASFSGFLLLFWNVFHRNNFRYFLLLLVLTFLMTYSRYTWNGFPFIYSCI